MACKSFYTFVSCCDGTEIKFCKGIGLPTFSGVFINTGSDIVGSGGTVEQNKCYTISTTNTILGNYTYVPLTAAQAANFVSAGANCDAEVCLTCTQKTVFTPCCGDGPISFLYDVSFDGNFNVYQYPVGSPLIFGSGGVILPGSCYAVSFEPATPEEVATLTNGPSYGDVTFVGKFCENINPGVDCLPCNYYYQVTNCADETETYCTTGNFSQYINNSIENPLLWPIIHLVQYPNKCFYVEQVTECVEPVNLTVDSSVPPTLGCYSCEEKLTQYYELINCNNPDITIYTSTDLQVHVGQIITLDEYPEDCWYVQILSTSTPSDIPVTFHERFPNCETCLGPQYLLEDCDIDNPDPNIITNTDLSAYVNPPGQVVTLLNCPDKCWLVSEIDPIPDPQTVHVIGNHTSCETCLQPPTPVVPDPPVYKSIRPGYNTPGCTPEKFERIVCNFSEAMYRQIMVDAYGITPCCGEDDIKYEIQYELIMLKAIQDPDYICSTTSTCECTTSAPGLSQNCSTN